MPLFDVVINLPLSHAAVHFTTLDLNGTAIDVTATKFPAQSTPSSRPTDDTHNMHKRLPACFMTKGKKLSKRVAHEKKQVRQVSILAQQPYVELCAKQ